MNIQKLNLTEKDKEILAIIQKNPTSFHSPTKIGIALGKKYNEASSYCTNSLKKLVEAGILQNCFGKYRLTEQI